MIYSNVCKIYVYIYIYIYIHFWWKLEVPQKLTGALTTCAQLIQPPNVRLERLENVKVYGKQLSTIFAALVVISNDR